MARWSIEHSPDWATETGPGEVDERSLLAVTDARYDVHAMSDTARHKDLDADMATFWRADDFDTLVALARPYEGPDEFAIDDLTDDEWDLFVAALDE